MTTPLRASAELEAVSTLGRLFHAECADILMGRKCHAHFEQWLWAARSDVLTDGLPLPVLPTPVAQAATDELIRKLMRAGSGLSFAQELCQKLVGLCQKLAAKLARPATGGGGGAVAVTSTLLSPDEPKQPEGGLLALEFEGAPRVLVSPVHLDKLRSLHTATAAAAAAQTGSKGEGKKKKTGGTDSTSAEAAFLADAYCTLARVLALQVQFVLIRDHDLTDDRPPPAPTA
jgi:hypothetical protein